MEGDNGEKESDTFNVNALDVPTYGSAVGRFEPPFVRKGQGFEWVGKAHEKRVKAVFDFEDAGSPVNVPLEYLEFEWKSKTGDVIMTEVDKDTMDLNWTKHVDDQTMTVTNSLVRYGKTLRTESITSTFDVHHKVTTWIEGPTSMPLDTDVEYTVGYSGAPKPATIVTGKHQMSR